ncbi:uncharacterized protein LOC123273847 [Cotesia glomerata]|uniref:uncharacterized protein LOC123273847 n=1 Tax=Cotesia glomerata TaxID=32391 RepID=UPI001D005AC9|nr:uncharacterized protein LOC123273847 [Cotesia glomerata]
MDDWKDIRYGDTLREFSASPGFTELKVNEELCYLDKGKDYQQSTERLLAGLANAVLTQDIIEWANQYPYGIGSQDLINMFILNFGEKSETFRNSEKMLQIICGKRASYIEARRERIINEAPNKQVQGALKRIPLSPEYLFGKEKLSSLITSLGVAQTWFKKPAHSSGKQSGSNSFSRIPRRDNSYTLRASQTSTSRLDQARPQYRKIFTKKDSAKLKQSNTFRKKDSR